ncbi:hypothetical protein [Kaarinaea lacus]
MTFTNALRGLDACGSAVASDTSGNGYVSLMEAHQYAQANMARSTPQIAEPDSLAVNTHIRKCKP